ncbi:MAG: T9SS type A sorting domain-containing protein, partial [Ignavibacteria bacterium]|nr:T9SS type A sorting domain-containing protein [Ignavibacteria bacterium]
GGVYSNSLVTVGNANFNSYDWPGFNFNWLYGTPYWSLGLYKVTNSKQTDKYFYLDSRDSDFGGAVYNPDFFVVFNNLQGVYQYKNVNQSLTTIPQGSLISVWQIRNQSPKTSGLQNYWSNVLVAVSNNSHPRLIWGPYPSDSLTINNYKVYRKYGASSWQLLTTVSSTTYEYTDGSVTLSGQQGGTDVQYKVTAIYSTNNETSASNIVTVNVKGGEIEKKGSSEGFTLIEFNLNQNYPNPFNPTTIISYSVAENSFVSLKVYDVLGNEISELVNTVKEAGNYSASFDASQLSSGIYFYTLKASGHSFTKKMLLAK